MSKVNLFVIILVCASLFSLPANAGKGNHNGQKNHNNEGKRVPIDGGITLLAAAGIGYGVKKISAKKKNENLHL